MMKERTNPKSVAPRKVKGTVLFTVVCVMMVLVVFLMGALALSATASRRAANTYSTAQTQATAKAGVEAVISAMQNNREVALAAVGIKNEAGKKRVDIGDITFSYMDDVTDDEGQVSREAINVGGLGKVSGAYMEYAGSKWVVEDGALVEKTIIKISATATQGTASSTYTAYIMRGINDDSKDGESQGFIATGSATSGNHTSVYGGAYIGFDDLFRDKTKMRAPSDPYTTYDFLDAASVYETDMHVNGTVDNNNSGFPIELVVKAPGTGLTIWGNLELKSDLLAFYASDKDRWSTSADIDYRQLPYVYVEGEMHVSNEAKHVLSAGSYDGKSTDGKVPFNIYCDHMKVDCKNDTTINADIYCMGTGTSTLAAGTSGKLEIWTARVIEPGKTSATAGYTAGSLFSKGSVQVDKSFDIAGNLVIDGDLILNGGNLNVAKNAYVGGRIIKSGGNLNVTGTLYCDDAAGYTASSYSDAVYAGTGYDPSRTIPEQRTLKEGVTKTDIVGAIPAEDLNKNSIWRAVKWYAPDGTEMGTARDSVQGNEEIVLDAGVYKLRTYTWHTTNVESETVLTPPVMSKYKKNGADISEAEALNITPAKYFDTTGKEIDLPSMYPKAYEREVLKGEVYLDGGKKVVLTDEKRKELEGEHKNVSEYKIIKTVSDILKSSADPYITYTDVPGLHKEACEKSENILTSGKASAGAWTYAGSVYTIKDDCTIQGSFGTDSFIIQAPDPLDKPEGIWIVLDGVTINNRGFVIDDSINKGQVNFLVKGECKFNSTPGMGGLTMGNGASYSWSEFGYFGAYSVASKMKDGAKHQIYTEDAYGIGSFMDVEEEDPVTGVKTVVNKFVPSIDRIMPANVFIYSEKTNASLYISNNTCMTAMVKAPYMNFEQTSMGGMNVNVADRLYYNGFDISKAAATNVGNIGCMICKNFKAGNNWVLLFTGSGASSVKKDYSDALFTSWSILYYDNY